MFIDLTPEQVALRDELRGYFAGLMSDGERAAMRTDRHGAVYREIARRMGRDGWLGVGWPVQYGGRGFGQVEQQIFADEALRADVQLPSVTLQTVGPTLLEHGTPEQKEYFLPRILAGEVHFAIGYTEPEAGTDLAALRTRAVRDGDCYVVNGQKIFTTGAHEADYIWLACRTDAPRPGVQKHRGISILIVPTSDPGFSWTPIITHDGAHHVNATYYSDVRVPASMLVGEENGGWRLITTQLNHERVMLGPAGRIAALRDRVRDWAAARGLADEPDVARALHRTSVVLRINELLNWQVATASCDPTVAPAASEASFADRPDAEARRASRPGDTTAGSVAGGGSGGLVSTPRVNAADASATKVFSSVQLMSLGPLLADVVGQHGDPADPQTADLLDWLDVQVKRNTVLTFGGGVNEIQRELIATAGLGLPRAPR
jgi:3-oxo-4-pregnene-20-carboxyl-CoA dehydrogenase beta subunit